MRVVSIVLNNFTNDSRVLKEAQTLTQIGLNIQIVALHEYPLEKKEVVCGINVHRILLKTRQWPKSKPVQMIKYIEFVWRVLRQYRHADVFHCHDLNALPIGVLAKKLTKRKVRLVYDAHEYEINDVPNQSKISIKIKYLLEKMLIKFADEVITVSNSIAEEYVRLYGIPKPHLVLNTPPLQSVLKQNLLREKFNIPPETNIFLYQGGLGYGRGIELILETFSMLPENQAIVFMGYGPLADLVRHYSLHHNNIFYHPAVKPEILLNYTASADFGILLYENNCLNHQYCSPNKIFEYIMAGLPVIVSNLYEMKRLVDIHHIGVVALNNNPDALKNAIQAITIMNPNELQKNLQKAKQKYHWQIQEEQLIKAYHIQHRHNKPDI